MKRILLSAALLLILPFGTEWSFRHAQRALLSVDGLSIPAGGALAAFHIDTWGVAPLAVCKIPPLWDIRAEKFMDPAGLLSGRSDAYHQTLTELDRCTLSTFIATALLEAIKGQLPSASSRAG